MLTNKFCCVSGKPFELKNLIKFKIVRKKYCSLSFCRYINFSRLCEKNLAVLRAARFFSRNCSSFKRFGGVTIHHRALSRRVPFDLFPNRAKRRARDRRRAAEFRQSRTDEYSLVDKDSFPIQNGRPRRVRAAILHFAPRELISRPFQPTIRAVVKPMPLVAPVMTTVCSNICFSSIFYSLSTSFLFSSDKLPTERLNVTVSTV